MKVLGINGSHRADKYTSRYLGYAMSAIEKEFETETVNLAELEIAHCKVCDSCKDGRCAVDDDMQQLYDKMRESAAILVASPVYFGTVSGRLKAMMDRTLHLRRDNMALSGKIGGAIAVGRSRNGGQELTIMTIHNWMLLHEMLVVSDKDTAHFGGTVYSGIEDDEIGKETSVNLAKKICETLMRIGEG